MYGQDVTSAWHAQAPAPPPGGGIMSPYSAASMSRQSSHTSTHKSLSRMASAASAVMRSSFRQGNSSSDGGGPMSASVGCAFDKHALGDDLPSSAHAPEPERPVSRNATARANARERERLRASTLGTHSSMSLFDYNREQIEQQRMQKEQEEIDRMQPSSTQQPGHTPLLARSPSRIRHDSSPAFGNTWSGYASPSMTEMPPPSHLPLHRTPSQLSTTYQGEPQSPAEPYYASQPVHAAQQYAWPQKADYAAQPAHYDAQQQYNYPVPVPQHPQPQPQPPALHYDHQQYNHGNMAASPSQYGGAPWQAQPQAYPPQEATSVPWSGGQAHWNTVGPAAHGDYAPSLASGTSSTISSPCPPTPHLQTWSGVPNAVSDCGYSSASPSRSSSRSSTVSRAHSVVSSASSVSGTVRRALPQPPCAAPAAAPQEAVKPVDAPSTPRRHQEQGEESDNIGDSTITASSVNLSTMSMSRHDSVRLAAEEIMARGSPRRRGMIPMGMRSKFDKPEASAQKRSHEASTSAAPESVSPQQNRPESRKQSTGNQSGASADELERAMGALRMNAEIPRESTPVQGRAGVANSEAGQSPLEKPAAQRNFAPRAASPRPMRAYPTPDPQIAMTAPHGNAMPDRPRSRGPKDHSEERKMSLMELPTMPPMPPKSPPPDRRLPDFAFNDGTGPVGMNVPSIMVGDADEEERQQNGHRTHAPAPQASYAQGNQPHAHSTAPPMAPHTHCHANHAGMAPQASISISQSTGNVAQRSTTSMPNQSLPQRHGPGMFGTLPAPVSASAVGSGASCSTCHKWISGRVVHAMNHNFHPDCFVCDHCGENLEHVAFYEHEGRAYCHFDYHELFSKRCFHCRTPIVDQRYITINDVELTGNGQQGQVQERCYHDMHFFCANCGDPFLDPKLASDAAGRDPLAETIEDENGTVRYGGREFVVHKGYPYCERCHVSLHKPKCKGCRHPIVDAEYLTALNAKWHVGCFCCEACKRPIDDDNFFVRDNVAYDEQCYKVKLRSEI